MAEGSKKLWERLHADRLYTKSYEEFQKQFSTPEKRHALHTLMSQDRYYTKTVEDFNEQFWTPQATQPRYSSTRDYSAPGRDTLLENIKLEEKFSSKYGNKDLWTRYAYINADEGLKDLLINNENKIDPYVMAGTISAEGLVDQLYATKKDNPDVRGIMDVYGEGSDTMSGIETLGIDNFPARFEEFKEKGLTSLEQMGVNWDESNIGKYFKEADIRENERGELIKESEFYSPQGAFNAVSAYLKNIESIIDKSGAKVTPTEREQLTYIGYNYGEGGLKQYLSKGKTGKDILNAIKKEKPDVFNKSLLRVAVANELRESRSLEPKRPPEIM